MDIVTLVGVAEMASLGLLLLISGAMMSKQKKYRSAAWFWMAGALDMLAAFSLLR